jgi:hypothetical protein
MTKPKTKSIQAILQELYTATSIKMRIIEESAKELDKPDIDALSKLKHSSTALSLWKELAPLHRMIRENNPNATQFFDNLDKGLADYENSSAEGKSDAETK